MAAFATRPAWLPELLWVLATALVTTLVTVVDLKLWRMDAHVPIFSMDGDGAYYLATVKGVVEHGWFWHNPDLGAPFGQANFDFAAPFGDVSHYVIVWLLGHLLGDPVVVFNAFFLLCFPLIAVVAYAVLRDLGAARPAALVGGLLFALLPYHVLRNETHLFLTSYYAIPLAVWLVVIVAEGRTVFDRAGAPRRTLLTAGACLVVGAASNYYAVFALLILVSVVPVAALARRSRAIALRGGAVLAVVGASFVLCHSPAIIYPLVHGTNESVAKRAPEESEQYALTLAYMVIPRPNHRAGFMAGRGRVYAAHTPVRSEGFDPSLGSVATLGLLGALIVLLTTGLGGGGVGVSPRRARIAIAGVVALAAFLIGTVGGGSALIAYELSPQVRAWGRLSLVVAFAALLAVALALTALGDRLRARGRPTWVLGVVAAIVGVVGVIDQTAPSDAPDYPAVKAAWKVDGDFVAAMERRLPHGTKVLQLPYMSYPENGPLNGLPDYGLYRGYLHSRHLRWTYGAIRGRSSDWLGLQAALTTEQLAAAAAAAGFGAVYVDRRGYADNGAAVTAALDRLAGPGTAGASADGRLAFYDLRPAAARLAAKTTPAERRLLSAALLQPVGIRFGAGFLAADRGEIGFRWASPDGRLELDNPLRGGRRVRLRTELVGGGPGPSTVVVTLPDGTRRTLTAGPAPLPVDLPFTMPHGAATLRLQTDGPAAPTPPGVVRDLRLRVADPALVYPPLVRPRTVADAMP